MAVLIDRIKVLEEMLGIMFQQGQESAYYDDKIEIGAMTYSDVEYENGKSDGMDIAYNMIADAPEIKAIPIEWIKKYVAEEGIYPNRELLSVEQADAIERMVENWEKENEEDFHTY